MAGLGTIINVGGIIAGGLIGLLFGRFLTEKIQDAIIKSLGVCVIFVGVSGALSEMMLVDGSKLTAQGTLMMIVCIALGTLIGEIIDFDALIERFGSWLKKKTGSENEKGFVQGFVSASVTVAVGAMAIIGALNDGISHDYSVLLVKTLLDMIIVMMLSSSLGKGCIFSAIPVAVIQGLFTLLAGVIQPVMTDAALSNLNLTGSVLIFCIGINLTFGNRIKVANMLPAIILATAWAYIPFLN